jgi:hypothetical protein
MASRPNYTTTHLGKYDEWPGEGLARKFARDVLEGRKTCGGDGYQPKLPDVLLPERCPDCDGTGYHQDPSDEEVLSDVPDDLFS